MGKLIGVIVLGAVLWCGWWALASFGLHRGIGAWVKDRTDRGWQIDIGATQKLGFPWHLHSSIRDVVVRPPATLPPRMAVNTITARKLDVSAPAYWPGYVTVATPFAQIDVAGPYPGVTIGIEDVIASRKLHPGLDLALDRMTFQTGTWTATGPAMGGVEGATFDLSMIQQGPNDAAYDLSLEATGVTPSHDIRVLLGLPDTWTDVVQTLDGRLTLTFDKPWNRHATRSDLPQPRRVQLHRAEIKWGDVGLVADGDLTVNADGLATGSVTVLVQDWPSLLNMVDSAGYLPQGYRPQAEQMLTGLAQMGGQTNGLDLTISLTDGRMSMGFIPLGRAPRIHLQ